MNFWKFNGQSLEFTVGELTIPKAFTNVGGAANVFTNNKDNTGKFGLNLVCNESEMINAVLKNQRKQEGGMNNFYDELENIYVTFLCIGFMNDTLITTGDDGFIYIWEH